MTQLTVPTVGSQGGTSIAELASSTISLVHPLDREGCFVAKRTKTTYGPCDNNPPVPVHVKPQTRVTASSKTPRTPRSPQLNQPLATPESEHLASEFISEWNTALHGPTRQLPRPGPHGTVRRGSFLLPPNLHRPAQPTPTRRTAKPDVFMAPRARPTKFLANNPDDWKPVGEWKDTSSMVTEYSASSDDRLASLGEEVVLDFWTDAMDASNAQNGKNENSMDSERCQSSVAGLSSEVVSQPAIQPDAAFEKEACVKRHPSMMITSWI